MPDRPTRVAVIGGGRANDEDRGWATSVGRQLASRGAHLYTGGLGGVMEAASRGASEAGGVVIGILPGTDSEDANPFVQIPVTTGMGEARNVILIRSVEVAIAIGGRFGTLSEIALALKMNKPVISLHSWSVDAKIQPADSPEEAVELALSTQTVK